MQFTPYRHKELIMELKNRTILITGGSSGIGLAFASKLASAGNTIIICGRDTGKLDAARNVHPAIAAYRCDISRDDEQSELVSTIAQDYPQLDVVINNAGVQYNYNFQDPVSHVEYIEEEINTNFTAHVKLTDRLLPQLLDREDAAIINITSALALIPKQSAPVYCASKAAMSSYTRALRYQLEGTQIKVFEIIPALVDTAMTQGRGKGKISADELVDESLMAFSKNRCEIKIEKAGLLFALYRLLPGLAERLIRYS
jgi:short-subunit dehydrogenase involved in D-alanine esterification of teichoic acids